MLLNCFKFRKNTESKNSRVEKTKNGRITLSPNCVVCGGKNRFLLKKKKLVVFLTDFFRG